MPVTRVADLKRKRGDGEVKIRKIYKLMNAVI